MKTFKFIIKGKRPVGATPERALELANTISQAEIARLWGISRQRVGQLIKKAKENNKERGDVTGVEK